MAQIYELLRVRKAGWLIPRYQHAFGRHPVGVLSVAEEYIPDMHRHTLRAQLLAPLTGSPMPEVAPLYDVRLLHWSCDRVTLTGFERVEDVKVSDCLQTWILEPAAQE